MFGESLHCGNSFSSETEKTSKSHLQDRNWKFFESYVIVQNIFSEFRYRRSEIIYKQEKIQK